jgi:hypothetical protein
MNFRRDRQSRRTGETPAHGCAGWSAASHGGRSVAGRQEGEGVITRPAAHCAALPAARKPRAYIPVRPRDACVAPLRGRPKKKGDCSVLCTSSHRAALGTTVGRALRCPNMAKRPSLWATATSPLKDASSEIREASWARAPNSPHPKRHGDSSSHVEADMVEHDRGHLSSIQGVFVASVAA